MASMTNVAHYLNECYQCINKEWEGERTLPDNAKLSRLPVVLSNRAIPDAKGELARADAA